VRLNILKAFLIAPLFPAVALGLEMELNWQGYLLVYGVSLGSMLAGIALLRLLYFIFKDLPGHLSRRK
jgi:hypothetical protein